MIAEWKADDRGSGAYGSIFAIALTDIDGYFALADGLREGRGPIPNLVPSDTFWIEADGKLAGTVHVRYELNAILMQRGGNIGYSVRPSGGLTAGAARPAQTRDFASTPNVRR